MIDLINNGLYKISILEIFMLSLETLGIFYSKLLLTKWTHKSRSGLWRPSLAASTWMPPPRPRCDLDLQNIIRSSVGYNEYSLNPLLSDRKNIIRSQCMGSSQYHRQYYITYHGYKYSGTYLASLDSSGSLGIISSAENIRRARQRKG